jgi:hypothetical protein
MIRVCVITLCVLFGQVESSVHQDREDRHRLVQLQHAGSQPAPMLAVLGGRGLILVDITQDTDSRRKEAY